MLGPLPRWLTECAYPFLPLSHRPSPKSHRVGSSTAIRSTTSEREVFRGCSHLMIFRPPSLLPPRSFPPLGIRTRCSGRPWRLRPSTARFVTSPRIGYASPPNRAIDGIRLSPTRFAALPAATRTFTSRLPTVRSPSPPLDMTTTWTGLLLSAGLSPAGMAASFAALAHQAAFGRVIL